MGIFAKRTQEHCRLEPTVLAYWAMKRILLGLALLFAASVSLLNCGSGNSSPSLSVTPASASISTNFANGTYQGAELTAQLSNGATPTNVQWTTSAACVVVSPITPSNTSANVVCNFTCGGGSLTATITATSGSLTGKSSVTCTWIQ
jgi:hypothetical protein